MINGIDHVGIAVKSIDEASRFWVDILGFRLSRIEEVPEQKVRVAILQAGETTIELLEPTSPDSPVQRFLEKRGEGLHHLTLETDDLAGQLQKLKAANVGLIDEQPRVGAGDAKIAFLHPKSAHGVLVELCEAEGKQNSEVRRQKTGARSQESGDRSPGNRIQK
jgi:methylmalonyl-CoA epimerase